MAPLVAVDSVVVAAAYVVSSPLQIAAVQTRSECEAEKHDTKYTANTAIAAEILLPADKYSCTVVLFPRLLRNQ
jgi:hypothetical protein